MNHSSTDKEDENHEDNILNENELNNTTIDQNIFLPIGSQQIDENINSQIHEEPSPIKSPFHSSMDLSQVPYQPIFDEPITIKPQTPYSSFRLANEKGIREELKNNEKYKNMNKRINKRI